MGVAAYRARRNVHLRRQRRRCGRSRTKYAPFHASLLPGICTISTTRQADKASAIAAQGARPPLNKIARVAIFIEDDG